MFPGVVGDELKGLAAAIGRVADINVAGLARDDQSALMVAIEGAQRALDAATVSLTKDWAGLGSWSDDGHRSGATWLVDHTQISKAKATRRVRTAQRLVSCPKTATAFADGTISLEHVETIVRGRRRIAAVFADVEEILVEASRHVPPADIAALMAEMAEQLADQPGRRHRDREPNEAFLSPVGAGWALSGTLNAETGATLAAAIDQLSDRYYHDDLAAETETGLPPRTPPQRRADAIGDIAAIALASHHNPTNTPNPDDHDNSDDTDDSDQHSGLGPVLPGLEPDNTATGVDPAIKIGGSWFADIDLVIPWSVLAPKPSTNPGPTKVGGHGPATLCGIPIRADVARQLACDANISRVITGPNSEPLDVGRSQRTANRAIRRAIRRRDRHCAFPGCTMAFQFCDMHHVVFWEHGGDTTLNNLVALCKHHHKVIHTRGFTVRVDPNTQQARFARPNGIDIEPRPDRHHYTHQLRAKINEPRPAPSWQHPQSSPPPERANDGIIRQPT